MQISSWLFRTIVSRFDSLAAKVDGLSSNLAGEKAMVQQLLQGQMNIMNTIADIKAAEEAFGMKLSALTDKVTGLETLSNNIFDKLSGSNVVNDPAVQDVLDMIAAHTAQVDAADASVDAAMTRDTAAAAAPASTPAPEPVPTDGSGAPPAP